MSDLVSQAEGAALADFSSHRIEGLARHGNTPFSAPLFSQIDGNLWMGGCPRDALPQEFKFVVCLYPWESYTAWHEPTILDCWLRDARGEVNGPLVHVLADAANAFSALGQTLVHCQAGLNRSGLVTALALVKRGVAPREAIDRLREARSPAVLCNASFEEWLLRQAPHALIDSDPVPYSL